MKTYKETNKRSFFPPSKLESGAHPGVQTLEMKNREAEVHVDARRR